MERNPTLDDNIIPITTLINVKKYFTNSFFIKSNLSNHLFEPILLGWN